MRESFGGAFMIRLVLVFIVIYVSFMAVAVNYAKAFRVKNHLVNLLEQSQYKTGDSTAFVDDYLASQSYYVRDSEFGQLKSACLSDGNGAVFTERGACIVPIGDCNNGSCYFRITTYISVDFPFFNLHPTLPIRGETKTMTY